LSFWEWRLPILLCYRSADVQQFVAGGLRGRDDPNDIEAFAAHEMTLLVLMTTLVYGFWFRSSRRGCFICFSKTRIHRCTWLFPDADVGTELIEANVVLCG
jgi:hypothetical protein